MKKIFISAILLTIACVNYSQQVPQVSHFMFDNVRINPGSPGSLDMINITAIKREQMTGFDGHPSNFILNADAPFNLLKQKHGVGISIYSDNIGFYSDIAFHLSYALRLNVANGTLGIGANAGFFQKDLKGKNWKYSNSESTQGDPNVPSEKAQNMAFGIGAGLFYRSEDIYFGASVINLNNPEQTTTNTAGTVSEATYIYNRHYFLTAGYNMQLTNPAWELKPGVLLKSDGVATDIDINLMVEHNKKIWGGVTYRTGEAVVAFAGFEIMENLKIGGSYDLFTNSLNKYAKSTYEIFLNYQFRVSKDKIPQKYKSIRFL